MQVGQQQGLGLGEYANRLSPVEFEKQYFNRLESVKESRGDSYLIETRGQNDNF